MASHLVSTALRALTRSARTSLQGTPSSTRSCWGIRWLHASRSMAGAVAAGGSSTDVQRRVRHLLLRPDQAELAEELAAQITSAEDLSQLAVQHSACPSKRQGGDLGWLSLGRTVPEFEAAAFGAEPGTLVTCQTQFGTHLLMVTEERLAASVQQMTPQELGELLAAVEAEGGSSDDVQLVDVREEREQELASLPGFQLLPLSRFEQWAPHLSQLLDPGKRTICLCHHGVRSMQMANYLLDQGFSDVVNVVGGIDAYARAVDSRVPLY